MWLVKDLDNDSIGIRAVKRGATVPVDLYQQQSKTLLYDQPDVIKKILPVFVRTRTGNT